MRLGTAARTSLASEVTGRDAASASLAIIGMIVGVVALVAIFGTGDGGRARPDDRRRTIALVVFAIAGFMLALGIFLAAL